MQPTYRSRSFNFRRPEYERGRDLPRLLPLWPEELRDMTAAGRATIVARLRDALRRERRRGVAGDWSYDLARHHQLAMAYRAEVTGATGPVELARNCA